MPPWAVVLLVLAGLAALTAFVLWIPVDVTARLEADGAPRFGVRLRWLFGLVTRELTARRMPREKIEEEPAKAERRKPGLRRGWKGIRSLLSLLRTKGLLSRLVRLVKEFFHCFRVNELRIDLRVGLDNPADTGLLFAVIAPVNFIPASRNRQVRVQPAFEDAALEGYAYGTLRLRPIRLVPPLAKFTLSPTTISAIIKMVRTNAK